MAASDWGTVLVPVGVGISFALFRWLFPVRSRNAAEPPLTAEEQKIYQRWEMGSLIPLFFFVSMLGYAWYLVLKWASDHAHSPTPTRLFLIRPSRSFWVIAALSLGAISAAGPLEWLYRWLLGNRYHRYERYCFERVGFDSKRVLPWLSRFVIIGSVITYCAGMTSFTRFDEKGIQIGRPLTFRSTFYAYRRVSAIEDRATLQARNGNIIARPHYVIMFDDGSSWSTRQGLRDPVPELDEQIARLVEKRSGKLIVKRP